MYSCVSSKVPMEPRSSLRALVRAILQSIIAWDKVFDTVQFLCISTPVADVVLHIRHCCAVMIRIAL